MNVLIENYRGYDIFFMPESERFSFKLDEGSWREKQSYAACKKNIDDFIKENEKFEPFYIIHKRDNVKKKVIGIKRNKRFVTENEIISDYYETDYFIYNESFYSIIKEREEIEYKIKLLNEELSKLQFTGETLREYKTKNFNL